MDPHERAVRDAAAALGKAIKAAEGAGYRVVMPRNASELERIAISATAKVESKPAKKS